MPKHRKRKKADGEQTSLVFDEVKGLSSEEQKYNPTSMINTIRKHVPICKSR